MKRIALLFVGLLAPLSVHAVALSPWVQGVLDRADMGINFAATRSAGTCEGDGLLIETAQNRDAVKEALQRSDDIAREMELFQERTVCLESDRRLLQEKIRAVLDAMDRASADCNIEGLRVLRSTFDFLHEGYTSFLAGSADPTYRDDLLRRRYAFEDEARWTTPPYADTGPEEVPGAPLCPFTTDYGPHTFAYPGGLLGSPVSVSAGSDIRSYGCDAAVLRSLPPEFAEEANVLADFQTSLDAFARPLYDVISRSLQHIDTVIAVLTGKKPPSSLSQVLTAPPHETLTGCLRPLSPEDGGVATPEEREQTLFAFPAYFDDANRRTDDFTGEPTYNPRPEELLPSWLLFRPAPRTSVVGMKLFLEKKEDMGANRPLPAAFSNAFTDMLSYVERVFIAEPMARYTSANNERATGTLEAVNRDPIERSEAAIAPLHRAVVSLTDAVDGFLVEQYVPSVAFFLARSCVDGHCQETLKTVLKRVHNPFCHPYISGDYKDPEAAQKCFCDESIRSADEAFWNEYCADTLTQEEIDAYRAREPDPALGCLTDAEERARIEAKNREREGGVRSRE